jgi:hypothetical protein
VRPLPGLYPGQIQDVLWANSSGSTLIALAHVPGPAVKDPRSTNSARYSIEFGVQGITNSRRCRARLVLGHTPGPPGRTGTARPPSKSFSLPGHERRSRAAAGFAAVKLHASLPNALRPAHVL